MNTVQCSQKLTLPKEVWPRGITYTCLDFPNDRSVFVVPDGPLKLKVYANEMTWDGGSPCQKNQSCD